MMYLTHDEVLEQWAYDSGVEIIGNYKFKSPRIKGLYNNNVIALSKTIQSKKEKSCILAEELGHHYMTYGDIIDQTKTENRKQEYKARLFGYNIRLGLKRIIYAYEDGCRNLYEMAEFLDVTEEFLNETIFCYRSKYGLYTKIDSYIIYFEPCLAVMKLI